MTASSVMRCVGYTEAAWTLARSGRSSAKGSRRRSSRISTTCGGCPVPDRGGASPTTREGRWFGFVVPARHHSDPLIAFVGILPEHRGRGYAYDLVVEGTRMLVAEGADRIVAGTDVTNAPMAATFARAGYRIEQHRIDFI
jgi:RimJ/RimL family protein N-acetyltransferase